MSVLDTMTHAIVWNKDLQAGLARTNDFLTDTPLKDTFTEAVVADERLTPLSVMDAKGWAEALIANAEENNLAKGVLYALPMFSNSRDDFITGAIIVNIHYNSDGDFIGDHNRGEIVNNHVWGRYVFDGKIRNADRASHYVTSVCVNPRAARDIGYEESEDTVGVFNEAEPGQFVIFREGATSLNSEFYATYEEAHSKVMAELDKSEAAMLDNPVTYRIVNLASTDGGYRKITRGIIYATYDYQADVYFLDTHNTPDAWYVFAL